MPVISLIEMLFNAVKEKDTTIALRRLERVSVEKLNNFVSVDEPFIGQSILQVAILNQIPKLIEKLMAKGADMRFKNSSQQTPIELAAINEQWSIVDFFSNTSTDMWDLACYGKALIHAVRAGQISLAIKLMQAGAPIGDTLENESVQYYVIKTGNIRLFEFFIKHYCSQFQTRAHFSWFISAVPSDNLDMIELIWDTFSTSPILGCSLMDEALSQEKWSVVQCFIDRILDKRSWSLDELDEFNIGISLVNLSQSIHSLLLHFRQADRQKFHSNFEKHKFAIEQNNRLLIEPFWKVATVRQKKRILGFARTRTPTKYNVLKYCIAELASDLPCDPVFTPSYLGEFLFHAVDQSDEETLLRLLSMGASIQDQGKQALLDLVIKKNDVTAIKLFLKNKFYNVSEVINYAIKKNSWLFFDSLIKINPDVVIHAHLFDLLVLKAIEDNTLDRFTVALRVSHNSCLGSLLKNKCDVLNKSTQITKSWLKQLLINAKPVYDIQCGSSVLFSSLMAFYSQITTLPSDTLSLEAVTTLFVIIDDFYRERFIHHTLIDRLLISILINTTTIATRSPRPNIEVREIIPDDYRKHYDVFARTLIEKEAFPDDVKRMLKKDVLPAIRTLMLKTEDIILHFQNHSPALFHLSTNVPLHTDQVARSDVPGYRRLLHQLISDLISAFYIAQKEGQLFNYYQKLTDGYCLDTRISSIQLWIANYYEEMNVDELMLKAHNEFLAYQKIMFGRLNQENTLAEAVHFISSRYDRLPCKPSPDYAPEGVITVVSIQQYLQKVLAYEVGNTVAYRSVGSASIKILDSRMSEIAKHSSVHQACLSLRLIMIHLIEQSSSMTKEAVASRLSTWLTLPNGLFSSETHGKVLQVIDQQNSGLFQLFKPKCETSFTELIQAFKLLIQEHIQRSSKRAVQPSDDEDDSDDYNLSLVPANR